MRGYHEKEGECSLLFSELGDCYHMWTPEDFELIFTNDEDFRMGMSMMAISAKLCPEVKILTFVLMSNHLHVMAAGSEASLMEMFGYFKRMLSKYIRYSGRTIAKKKFVARTRKLESLNDVRNVIVYDNRNGFVVNQEYSPFTYPWGACRYYFNPDAKRLALNGAKHVSCAERRRIARSHMGDRIGDLLSFDGYALPLSFCAVSMGERLFRDASHYFNKLSKSMESNKAIASEVGEKVFYTDDELYSAMIRICNDKFDGTPPLLLPVASKVEVARILHYDFNSSSKQIVRMLKLPATVVKSLGFDGMNVMIGKRVSFGNGSSGSHSRFLRGPGEMGMEMEERVPDLLGFGEV